MIIGYGFTTSQIRHECESQLVNGGVAAVDTSCLLRLESEGFVVKNDKEACLLNEAKRREGKSLKVTIINKEKFNS